MTTTNSLLTNMPGIKSLILLHKSAFQRRPGNGAMIKPIIIHYHTTQQCLQISAMDKTRQDSFVSPSSLGLLDSSCTSIYWVQSGSGVKVVREVPVPMTVKHHQKAIYHRQSGMAYWESNQQEGICAEAAVTGIPPSYGRLMNRGKLGMKHLTGDRK